MLRVILAVAGVVFIGLGVFGDKLFSSFGNTVVPQAGSLAQVEVPAVAPAAEPEVASVAVENMTEETPIVVAEVTTESAVLEESKSTIVIADASGESLAEPLAPAQAAGDLIAMAEEAKSSSRNEQVDIAKAVLASAKQPLAQIPIVAKVDAKAEEVESVMVSTAGETGNDMLMVIKDKVNLRDGPSIDHPIVLQLEQGQELMEFKREGKWVHVGAYGTSGKIGWVHERLVGAVAK